MSNKRDLNLEEFGISLSRYRELYYFCQQYREKKEELQRCYSVTSEPTSKRSENTHMLTNFAEQQTDKTNKLSRDIGLIEQTAQEAVGGLYPFILKNVTEISRMNIWEYHVDDASFIVCEENFSVYWTRRKGNCQDLFGY